MERQPRPAHGLHPPKVTGQRSYMDDPTTTAATEGFGLMFYNARWYDPALGRFAQADTIVPVQSQGTQAWDRYAYVNNNPLKYMDSSGHMIDDGPFKRNKKDDVKIGSGGAPACSGANWSVMCASSQSTNSPTQALPGNSPQYSTIPESYNGPTVITAPYTGPVLTPPSSSAPSSPYLGWPPITIKVDWDKVDKIDAIVDGIGIAADLVALIPPAAPIAQGIGTTVEGFGTVKSAVELYQGNPQSILVSQTTHQAKVVAMIFRVERLIPVSGIGAFGNLVSLAVNIQPQIGVNWVTP